MSKKNFHKLNKPQQDAVIAAGKKAQAYYEGRPTRSNEEAIKAFKDHKVKVVTLTRRRIRRMDRSGEEELLCQVRQGRSERQEADRRSAGGEVAQRLIAGSAAARARRRRRDRLAAQRLGRRASWKLTSGSSRSCRGSPASSAPADRASPCWSICDMVIERYILNLTTIWQIDVVTYCIVGATFIGSPYVLMTRGHVNVDVLPLHLGPTARYWLALGTSLMALAFCVVMFVLCTAYWYEAYDGELAFRHGVARAAVDSVSLDAGRSRPARPAIRRRHDLPGDRARAAVRHLGQENAEDVARAQAQEALGGRHEPDDARRARSRRHAADAGLGRSGGVRPRRDLDRLPGDLPGLRQRCTSSPRPSGRASTTSRSSRSRCS